MQILRSSSRPVRVLAAVGVLAALTACWVLTGSRTERGAIADAKPAPPRSVTPHEAQLLDRAEQIFLSQCMERNGFRFWVTPRAAGQASGFPYVVDDVGWARKHGYGTDIERRVTKASRSDPNRRYFASLSSSRQQAALRALNGGRPDGLEARLPSGIVVRRSDRSCTSQAERQLYGDLAGWYRASKLTESLFGVRAGHVTAHASFGSATRRWATCMRTHGHRYASPFEARAAATRSGAARRRSTERRIAVAEATCARATGLSATATQLDRHYRNVVNSAHRAGIAAARRLQLAALPRARAAASHDLSPQHADES